MKSKQFSWLITFSAVLLQVPRTFVFFSSLTHPKKPQLFQTSIVSELEILSVRIEFGFPHFDALRMFGTAVKLLPCVETLEHIVRDSNWYSLTTG